jgi:hypothetical protein
MVSVPYKNRLKLRKEADRALRSITAPDELRAILVDVAGQIVESFDEGYSELFNPEDPTFTKTGVPASMRPGRERIWRETCGKQRTLWKLVGERLLTIDVVSAATPDDEADVCRRLATIWATALNQEKKYVI